ncbi:MAG: FtsX-like permease family protein [Dehalococcoidia bacterium]|nr:FtsX-like permease family protein [Dehalococcoidia bacterium]
MNALFGIPMNYIMIALLIMLGVCLGTVAYVALRNGIIFKMGLRNMPRRVAQTVLIVLGLMLSTLIISAAFATGDTVDYSISGQAYSLLGHVDITVERQSESDHPNALAGSRDVPGDQYAGFKAAMANAGPPDVDAYMGVLFEEVPVVNEESRLSEPSVAFVGLDQDLLAGFPDVVSASSGRVLDVSTLAPDQVFMNETAADELGGAPGQRLQVYINSVPHEFTVVDIVRDRVITGTRDAENREGLVTRLDTLHGLFGHDRVGFIAVSINGGVRDTLASVERTESDLKALFRRNSLDLDVGDSKRDAVDLAEQFGNFMTTFFLLMGLFSICAGMLLIIMIFVMLAAERKSEMGMARAVGMKRGHLVQMFVAEGTVYNILSAMIGAVLGVLVAFALAYLMAAIFSEFGISITPHVTLRTLVISYSLGVVLTFLTVTIASWRVSFLNVVAAIRGLEDPRSRRQRRQARWLWVLLGIPALALPPLGLWLIMRKGLDIQWGVVLSVGGVLLGALLLTLGIQAGQAFPFALGFSLTAAGVARLLTVSRAPDRPVYTAMGLGLVIFWGLLAGRRLEFLFGEFDAGIEMFFLSGVAMVTASTFVLIYNADVILAVVSRAGGVFGSILPALKTAIAYPLHNRFRTGMTLAMISLVVFALTMMSTMNLNFDRLFLRDESRGGWDVQVVENRNNAIADLPAALAAQGSQSPQGFRAVGRIEMEGGFNAVEVRSGEGAKFQNYLVKGVDDAFIDGGQIPLEARARGMASEAEVWQALKTQEDVALIDAFAVRSGFGPQEFTLSGVEIKDDVFDPVPVEVRDPASGQTRKLTVIGVIAFGSSSNFQGVFISDRTYRGVFGEAEFSVHYVALNSPGESKAVAREIESSLLTAGVQAKSLKEIADKNQALSRNFLYLMQAFMGLGLFVGIAAVGVIAFRTVVERRQHIGMLRAIGYKRSMVALSFLLESSFVTLMGIFSGMGLALWLSYFLVTSEEFPGDGKSYFVPWLQIAGIGVFTFVASLLMTWIPSQQAARIPTAEALRYE